MNQIAEQSGITEILREDHRKIKNIFFDFERAEDKAEREELAQAAFTELTIHGTAEEEIFYPAIRERIQPSEWVDVAVGEHQVAKELITELENMKPGEEGFESGFINLMESVREHILEEESFLFPKIEEMDEIDLQGLGEEILNRQASLREELEDLTERARKDSLTRNTRGRKSAHRAKSKKPQKNEFIN